MVSMRNTAISKKGVLIRFRSYLKDCKLKVYTDTYMNFSCHINYLAVGITHIGWETIVQDTPEISDR